MGIFSETLPLACTLMLPAFPWPRVPALNCASLATENDPAWMLMLPPRPLLPEPRLVNTPLLSEIANTPRTLMLTSPPIPCPSETVTVPLRIKVLSSPPLVKNSEPALILMLPPLPTDPASTLLKAPLGFPLLFVPSKETRSLALIITFPASPCPRVLGLSCAPLVSESSPVVMRISPPLPLPVCSTLLRIAVLFPSNKMRSPAVISILPAFPTPKVLATNRASFAKDNDPA